MQQLICFIAIILNIFLIQNCQSLPDPKPKGFPKQFVAILNQTSYLQWKDSGVPQQLVYDLVNQRARFDVRGWRAKQNETYIIQYKPKGAERGSVSSNH